MALICTHLAHSVSGDTPLGFHEHDEGDMGRPDAGVTNVIWYWIKQKQKMNSMNGLPVVINKIICVNCWDEVKIQNINTSDE